MKRFLFLLTVSMAVLCASASNKYVSPTGDDGDGKSWAHAKKTIAGAKWGVGVGDTMFIAEGVYNESIPVQDGATYLGGYNAETGERDIEKYQTILDGTDVNDYLIVRYLSSEEEGGPGYPTHTNFIEGFTLQNLVNPEWGGGAIFLRGNMTVSRCQFINCKGTNTDAGAGAIFIEKDNAPQKPLVTNCVFEFCEGLKAAAIYNNGPGIIENCIFRGCSGTRAVLRNYNAGGQVRNCVIYNCAITGSSSKVLENNGTTFNTTICNNYSDEYASYTGGSAKMYNCVIWGNKSASGFTDEPNYISSSSTSGNNVADHGSSSSKFISVSLAADNNAVDGPNFRNPTGFVGVPKTDVEKAAVRKADFSLTDASVALIDKGTSEGAPDKDINGVARPKKDGYDVGAYEYDPDAVVIAVTGVSIVPSSIEIIEGKTGTLVAQVEPADANNKRVEWTIENPEIATIKNGVVTGVKEGTTTAWVKTEDGDFTASATVIIKPKPPVKYPKEVLEAEAMYKMEDYTVPSYIRFLVPKTAAKIDSLDPDNAELLPKIALYLDTMQMMISELQPKETPYNQIATFNGDPATHMGFCWFTNGGITEGKVQLIAKANATAEDFAGAGVIEVSAQTSDATLHYTPIQESESPKYDICTAAGLPRNTKFNYVSHKAQATTLNPGTVYSWRVGFDGHWSEIGQFVTKDANQGDFSFVYMSDSHIQDAVYIEQAQQCAKAVVKNESDVKFCIFPGDFVDTGGKTNSEWQWERWFEGSMRPALNKMAFVPTDGNHDDSPSLNYDYHFNTDWGFANGASVKPQFKGITYSFVYGDVLFLVFSMQDWWRESGTHENEMHSKYFTTDIRNWFLEQVEAHPEAKYRVTLSHKNVFSGAGHHEDDECTLLRTMMVPIMKECGIDLAIQGHDHCYEVIGPVDPETWTVVPGSVTDTTRVAPEATGRWERSSNKTGLEGGTFTVDDGTLYFIGATCGRKRYEPYNRYVMDTAYVADITDPKLFDNKHHNVKNLFDLFTSKFGQPGSPSYTRFNVTGEGIEMITYKTDAEGNKEVYNTIHVKRTKPHTLPTGFEDLRTNDQIRDGEKFIRNGQLFIRKDGQIYNVIGQKIAQ